MGSASNCKLYVSPPLAGRRQSADPWSTSGILLVRNGLGQSRPRTTAVQWVSCLYTMLQMNGRLTVSSPLTPVTPPTRSHIWYPDIRTWHSNIEQHASDGVNKILIGNKSDWSDKRAVTEEQGRELANELGIKFMETSAKVNDGVEEAFFTLARSALPLHLSRCTSLTLVVFDLPYDRDIKTRLIDSQADAAGAPGVAQPGSDGQVKVNQPATQNAGGCC